MSIWLWFSLGCSLVVLACAVTVTQRWNVQRRSLTRLYANTEVRQVDEPDGSAPDGFISRWLFLAGFRRPSATASFVVLTATLLGIGIAISYVLVISGTIRMLGMGLAVIPGNLGNLLLPMVYLAPWVVSIGIASLPYVKVQAARRRIVEQVEQDLPVTLELLATLGEVGLGFDSALDRILTSQPGNRPLPRELRSFQLEALSGRGRVECLRRLGHRLDVMSLTVFVSALIQAEQMGVGLAGILRQQADELRDRRRERALEFAMTLPVKRLFPMMVCFLPGIFVFVLGPTFHQFFQFAESLTSGRGR
ncbi:MAG: type secretion system protein [Planctomycetaceae bacterium]|nr:type secretion system protein [Planctomycetaceae bacterium]